ncbi:MAG: VanZ family protein, partial [Flavobacteriales bacterium]|nr:VanZ family protein [Flavobacteriales bacterium]
SGADKVVHVILFGIEAFLLSWSLHRQPKFRVVFYVLLWSFVLGGGLELVQHSYIEGRSGEPLDLLADMVGALLAVLSGVLMQKRAV